VRRPREGEVHPVHLSYVAQVPEGDVLAMLERNLAETRRLAERFGEERAGGSYAPGKWSVKQVLSHLADTERILTYRALCIARGERASLPGFEENEYAAASDADRRPLTEILDELASVRRATSTLFAGLSPTATERRGTANGAPLVVCATPYVLVGHELHHAEVLRARYLPALVGGA